MILLLGSWSIKQRQSPRRGKAEHTSLSASTYKRLSFILLKCYLINVLVTLNISTAGGTFVIVEMAGRVGHRWELLPHAGVDVRAAGRTRWASVIDNPPCAWIVTRERPSSRAGPGLNELQQIWQKSCRKVKSGAISSEIFPQPKSDWLFLETITVNQWIKVASKRL